MPSVGDRLKFSRENKMVSQIKVYKDTGIHNKTLSGYERGVSEPDLETISVLAKYYGVSTDYLLGRTNYKINDINEINYVKKEQGRYISLIEDLTSLSEDSQEEIKKLIELYKIKEMQDRNKSKDIKSNKKLNKVY
jgi:transcriptional regulator with XRE-family HTH domain